MKKAAILLSLFLLFHCSDPGDPINKEKIVPTTAPEQSQTPEPVKTSEPTGTPAPATPPPALTKPQIHTFTFPEQTFTSRVYLNMTGDAAIFKWIVTETSTPPSKEDVRWSTIFPFYDLQDYGSHTLYAWAMDYNGGISDSMAKQVEYKSFSGDWTIMIWMAADNNLEPMSVEDFNEMENGLFLAEEGDSQIREKLAIVVEYDRIEGYDDWPYDSGSNWYKTRRYLVTPDSDPNLHSNFTSQKLYEPGEINTGDPQKLKEFIQYSKTNFPAKHYALILWNHGGGIRGTTTAVQTKALCWDEGDSLDCLFVGEITDYLSDDEDVDLIGFDACLMGMTEVAYEYRPLENKFGASYMTASPSEEQGEGWDYRKIVGRFSSDGTDSEGDLCYNIGDITPRRLSEILVKEYRDASFHLADQSMSSFDLSKIENVKNALNTLASELTDKKTEIELLRGDGLNTGLLEYFNEKEGLDDENDLDLINDYAWCYAPHFDLYDFAKAVYESPEFETTTQAAAAALQSAVDECVITSYAGTGYTGTAFKDENPIAGRSGLGFFLPLGDRFFEEQYKKHYYLQWWYTSADTWQWHVGKRYGKLDFCASDSDGIVETWRELLEFWYDEGYENTEYTPGTY